MGDMNWRDKDDLDLTSEDIDAMITEGCPVEVRGPKLPAGAAFITSSTTFVISSTLRPEVYRPQGRLVGPMPTHAAG